MSMLLSRVLPRSISTKMPPFEAVFVKSGRNSARPDFELRSETNPNSSSEGVRRSCMWRLLAPRALALWKSGKSDIRIRALSTSCATLLASSAHGSLTSLNWNFLKLGCELTHLLMGKTTLCPSQTGHRNCLATEQCWHNRHAQSRDNEST